MPFLEVAGIFFEFTEMITYHRLIGVGGESKTGKVQTNFFRKTAALPVNSSAFFVDRLYV
jgi:hypothetical protein